MKRRNLLFFVTLFTLLVSHGALQLHSAEKSNIATTLAINKAIVNSATASGKIVAKRSAVLKFQTAGKLVWVGVKIGDTVVKGQAIASLDGREVRKNLEKALRDYSNERSDFEQSKQVTYQGFSLPNTVPNDTIKRILEKNQWDLEKAVLDVELKALSVEYSTISSPIAGIVTGIDANVPGVNITPATAAFTVIDPTSLVFETSVDESDINSVAVGQKATVTLDAISDKTFDGIISYVSFIASTSSGGSTIFPVEISINTDQQLRVGYNGDATIVIKTSSDVLTIPSQAIQEKDNTLFVYRKKGSNFEKIDVKIGITNDIDTQIVSGISVGDEVVTKGFDAISKK